MYGGRPLAIHLYGNETKSVGLGLVWVGWVPIARLQASSSRVAVCRSPVGSGLPRITHLNSTHMMTLRLKLKLKLELKPEKKTTTTVISHFNDNDDVTQWYQCTNYLLALY